MVFNLKFLFLVIFFSPLQTALGSQSKLELGGGLLAFKIPHYRGSDQMKDYFLPVPFFIYNSKNIQAEPSFIRGTFFTHGLFSLKLSLLAGLAVESENNRARADMPDLGFTVEVGSHGFDKIVDVSR